MLTFQMNLKRGYDVRFLFVITGELVCQKQFVKLSKIITRTVFVDLPYLSVWPVFPSPDPCQKKQHKSANKPKYCGTAHVADGGERQVVGNAPRWILWCGKRTCVFVLMNQAD